MALTGLPQSDRHPVVCVNWNDTKAYVAWLSKTTAKTYRLLSETEREYVARAGTTTPSRWGSTISTSQANYDGNKTYAGGTKGEFRKGTVSVDTFATNPWVFTMFTAMSGNGRRTAGTRRTPVIQATKRAHEYRLRFPRRPRRFLVQHSTVPPLRQPRQGPIRPSATTSSVSALPERSIRYVRPVCGFPAAAHRATIAGMASAQCILVSE